jgi:hypothetical protein
MSDLNSVLAAYDLSLKDDQERQRIGRAVLEPLIESSPALKANFESAIASGYVEKFVFSNDRDGSGGSYHSHDKSIKLNDSSFANQTNMIFVLGHEVQHAQSIKGADTPHSTALDAAIQRATTDANGAPAVPINDDHRRDYTQIVQNYVNGVRAEEAQAHIGGFNAINSFVEKRLGHTPTLKELYQAEPGRMSDFIDRSGISPFQSYQLKQGLTRSDDGSMALNDANIDKMKIYYADKFPGTFGDNHLLDYKHEAVLDAWAKIHAAEQQVSDNASRVNMNAAAQQMGPDGNLNADHYATTVNSYKINFAQGGLNLNPALLNFPPDGVVEVPDITRTMTLANIQADATLEPLDRDQLEKQTNPATAANAVVKESEAIVLLKEQGVIEKTFAEKTSENWQGLKSKMGMSIEADADSDPPLVKQAKAGIDKLWPESRYENPEAFENTATALAAQAQKLGLNSIDHVLASKDGDRLIAAQGQDPSAPQARLASIVVADAVQQPSNESLKQLQPPQAQSTSIDPQQQPQLSQPSQDEQPRRASMH